MSTSERRASRTRRVALVLGFAGACVLGLATANCGPSEECLRFSDCDEGFTCSNGRCRSTEELAAAPLEVEAGEGGVATDAKATDATPSKDAASDVREGGADGTSSDAPTG